MSSPKRCPSGSHRNKSSGKCEPISEAKRDRSPWPSRSPKVALKNIAYVQLMIEFVHLEGDEINASIDSVDMDDPFGFIEIMKLAGITLEVLSTDGDERITVDYKITSAEKWPPSKKDLEAVSDALNAKLAKFKALGCRTCRRLLTDSERKLYSKYFWHLTATAVTHSELDLIHEKGDIKKILKNY